MEILILFSGIILTISVIGIMINSNEIGEIK
jgi:hypothetical protein